MNADAHGYKLLWFPSQSFRLGGRALLALLLFLEAGSLLHLLGFLRLLRPSAEVGTGTKSSKQGTDILIGPSPVLAADGGIDIGLCGLKTNINVVN